jgi:hypothetical protein
MGASLALRVGVSASLVTTGCYAELGAGYYPSIKQTIDDPKAASVANYATSGWSVTMKLGFYLGVPIPPLHTGVGVGYSPNAFGGDPVIPHQAPADMSPTGTTWRGDLMLPWHPIEDAPAFAPHLTIEHMSFTGASIRMDPGTEYEHAGNGSGSGWFIGPSFGAVRFGAALLGSVGYQQLDCVIPADRTPDRESTGVETVARGFSVNVMIGWTPSGALIEHYVPSESEPQERGNAGCYYADHREPDGTVTTQWTCP